LVVATIVGGSVAAATATTTAWISLNKRNKELYLEINNF
jgi:hypothetical protein